MHNKGWIILIVVVLAVNIFRLLKPKLKGASGEAAVSLLLSRLPADEYTTIHNVMLRTERGTSQIDHVVISVYGIFAIEVKNFTGWISGTEKSSQWTQAIYKTKNRFMNPIRQNYGHVKALEALLNQPKIPIYSIVTFPGDAILKLQLETANVVKWGALNKTIKQLSVRKVMDTAQAQQIVQKIQRSNIDNEDTRKEHIQEIQQKKGTIKAGVCPRPHRQKNS